MSFHPKKVLLVGATSGIGHALASKFVSEGSKVIVVGRRQDKLDAFVKDHGADQSSAARFDVTNLSGVASFAARIASSHPDLDCVVLNSGVQRPFNFAKPETVDLKVLDEETTTNYTAAVHLTAALLPILQRQAGKTSLVYVSAALGIVPGMIRTLNYNASKAALHSFILALREQLKAGPGDISVVEVFPPAVQTELHDEKHQPDLVGGSAIGMPLDAFTEELWEGLGMETEQVAVGQAKMQAESDFERGRQVAFHKMTHLVGGMLEKFLKK